MEAFLFDNPVRFNDGKMKIEVGLSENRRSSATGLMPLNDSAEKFKTPALNCQDTFAGTGCD
jgi:hypothetical protein